MAKDSGATRAKGRKGGPQPGSGRPTKFDEEVASRVVLMVRAGNYLETAASASGVSPSTLREWLRTGRRAGKGKLFDFAERVDKALAESEAMDVNKMLQHGQKDWRALAWRLERRFPDRWREVSESRQTGKDGGPIEVEAKMEVTKYKYLAPKNPIVDGDG